MTDGIEMIDTKKLRQKISSVDIVDHIDLHANIRPLLSEMIDRLEAAEKELESWKGLARQFGNEADNLRTHLSFAKDELNRLRAKIGRYNVVLRERDAMRAMLRAALDVLEDVKGNINPERGYADELEADVERAIATIVIHRAKGE